MIPEALAPRIEFYQMLIREKGLTPPIYPPPPGNLESLNHRRIWEIAGSCGRATVSVLNHPQTCKQQASRRSPDCRAVTSDFATCPADLIKCTSPNFKASMFAKNLQAWCCQCRNCRQQPRRSRHSAGFCRACLMALTATGGHSLVRACIFARSRIQGRPS